MRQTLKYIYILMVVIVFVTLGCSVFHESYFFYVISAIGFGVGLLVLSRCMFVIRELYRSWRDDLILPIERLIHTICLLSENKLELLPEERRTAFTSEIQSQLLDMARGILEHQRFVDQVVDNMFEMMFLLSPDGVILRVNKAACETTRFQIGELVGQHVRKLFPHAENLVDYYLELEIQFTTQGIVRDMEVHILSSDGEILPFSLNGVKVESGSGDVLGYTIIAKNMIETFRLINQLNRSNTDLGQANGELEKRYDQIKKEIEEQEQRKKVLEMELATSQLVQKTFLPQFIPEHPRVELHGTAVPAAFCGGDWWNVLPYKDKYFCFIGDVTGHGTASAMVTAAVSGFYVSVCNSINSGVDLDVDDILSGFDSVLSNMAHGNVSYAMTCFACVFDFKSKTLRYANAGHNFPIIVRPGQKMQTLVASGDRLGNNAGKTFEKHEVPLTGGEFLFFYTDGLIENRSSLDEPWGKRRLKKFIEVNIERDCKSFVNQLLKESLAFYGDEKPLEDDVTFFAVRIADY